MTFKLLRSILGYELRGDYILEIEKNRSDLDVCSTLQSVRRQGATDKDIRQWWNMPNSEMEALTSEDDKTKLAIMKSHIDTGMSYEDAATAIKKAYPIYAIYKPGLLYGVDDPLPYELKHRVNKYFIKNALNRTQINNELNDFTTMNAYIRHKIKEGKI